MLPVAPGGTGQPPSSPKLDSNELQPASQRGEHVREPLAAGVVEVRGQLDPGELAAALEEVADLDGVGHAGRVSERDLRGAGVDEAPGDRQHALGRHATLVGAAEAHADDALGAQALGDGAADHALEAGQRLLDRAVDVGAGCATRSRSGSR